MKTETREQSAVYRNGSNEDGIEHLGYYSAAKRILKTNRDITDLYIDLRNSEEGAVERAVQDIPRIRDEFDYASRRIDTLTRRHCKDVTVSRFVDKERKKFVNNYLELLKILRESHR